MHIRQTCEVSLKAWRKLQSSTTDEIEPTSQSVGSYKEQTEMV